MRKYQIVNKICLLIFIQLLPFQSFSQYFDFPTILLDSANIIVSYKLDWKQDTNDLNRIRHEKMTLLIGKEVSLFMSYNFYQLRLIGRKAEKEGRLDDFLNSEEITNLRTRFSYSIYKNYPKGKITYTDKVLPAFLKYEENFDLFKWQLSDQVDTINGYFAHCAYTNYGGRRWVAWYAPDIPLSDGPYKFRGLPGLILMLYDDQKHYTFTFDEIVRPKEVITLEYLDIDWVKTKRIEFLKAESNFKNDIISRAKETGADNVSQRLAAQNLSRRNNPIELK